MSAAVANDTDWEAHCVQHEGAVLNEIELCVREEELEAVLSFLRREGSAAYLCGLRHRQELLAEMIGKLERGEHRNG